uniref:Uncharacterized protein n=1 Tax=Cannabis sativa TaxID=3483 RepID=A0A803PL63_CANSA
MRRWIMSIKFCQQAILPEIMESHPVDNGRATTIHANAQTTVGHGTTGQIVATGHTTNATAAEGGATNGATGRGSAGNFIPPNNGIGQTQTSWGPSVFRPQNEPHVEIEGIYPEMDQLRDAISLMQGQFQTVHQERTEARAALTESLANQRREF